MIGGLLRAFIIVIVASGLMATIFTWWTPNGFISDSARQGLSIAMATDAVTQVPTALPTPNWARKIGIVSGHRGNDSGAVCPDGLTEASINLSVAELVVQNLRGWAIRSICWTSSTRAFNDYQAATLLSIHSNTCQNFGEAVNGFIVAACGGAHHSACEDDKRLVRLHRRSLRGDDAAGTAHGNHHRYDRLPYLPRDLPAHPGGDHRTGLHARRPGNAHPAPRYAGARNHRRDSVLSGTGKNVNAVTDS